MIWYYPERGEAGEAQSFGIVGAECLLQEIVGQVLVPSVNHLVG